MVQALILSSEQLRTEIDPGRGADILSLYDRVTGAELLFSTPWRSRADAIRAGQAPLFASNSEQAWLEQYRGGWQTLCPNAGPARDYRGVTLGFHGEASAASWTVVDADRTSANLAVELFTVPLRITRRVSIVDASLHIVDEVTNTSDTSVTVDYSHHPAFGGLFLDTHCEVTTNAVLFTPDSASDAPPLRWDDVRAEMSQLPSPGARIREFGWLSGFPGGAEAWAAIANPTLGVTVRLCWDAGVLPHAWWWQEFNSSEHFPWYRKARVFAIEPASTPTGGPSRVGGLTIAPGSTVRIPLLITIEHTGDPAAGGPAIDPS